MRVTTTITLGAALDRLAVLGVKTKCMPEAAAALMRTELSELSKAVGAALAKAKAGVRLEQVADELAHVHTELFHFENAAAKLASRPPDPGAIFTLYSTYLRIRALNSERHRIVARIDGADAEPKVYR